MLKKIFKLWNEVRTLREEGLVIRRIYAQVGCSGRAE
jgi:hypothetical protein